MRSLENLLTEALDLPEQERAHLAHELLRSLDQRARRAPSRSCPHGRTSCRGPASCCRTAVAMRVRFHPDAQHELAKAVVWYEQRREGLGFELQRTVRDAVTRIASHPAAWPRWPELPEVRVY